MIYFVNQLHVPIGQLFFHSLVDDMTWFADLIDHQTHYDIIEMNSNQHSQFTISMMNVDCLKTELLLSWSCSSRESVD